MEGLWDPQEIWADGKGSLQHVFCCGVMDDTEALDLEKTREK